MLVLTRQANQSIMIGNDVVVSVLEIHGDQVRIGIDAPRHVTVYREEIWAEVQAANRAAAAPDGELPPVPPAPAAPPAAERGS